MSSQLTFIQRKRGVSSLNPPNLGKDTPGYAEVIHRQLSINGFYGTSAGDTWTHGSTVELVFGRNLIVEDSNSTNNGIEPLKWRVSVAATSHHKEVNYSPVLGLASTSFSFGDYSNPEKMAADTTKELSGYRTLPTPGAPGAPGQFYNSSQQKIENNNLCKALGEPKNQQVNVSLLWNRVWWVHHTIRLIEYFGARWNARPVLPIAVDNQLMGLNTYHRTLPYVQSGVLHHIEIREADIDLIPYIYILMGSSHNTFNLDFEATDGNQKIAHHFMHRLPLVEYQIYIVDMQNALPAGIANNHAYPGLPAQDAIANQPVGVFNEALLRRAMLAICSSGCIAGDMEAAWISNSVGLFAENFRGVASTELIGSDAHHPGSDGLIRGGATPVPNGNGVCTMFTFLTNGSEKTNATRDLMVKLLQCSSELPLIRHVIEPFILAFQHASRQVGMMGPAFFKNARIAGMYSPGVNLSNDADSIKRHVFEGLASAHPMNPSPVMYMTSLILERFFKCKMPDIMMFYGIGDSTANGHSHYDNTEQWGAKRGQVPVSVHPAQLPNALWKGDSAGLPGIPYKLDLQAHETSFRMLESGRLYGVQGRGESRVGSDNVIDFEVGTGMLGHSVILRRDRSLNGVGHAKVIMSTARADGHGGDVTMAIEAEDFPRAHCRAFVPDNGETDESWDAEDDVRHDHMELYSDFDYLSSKELNLGLSTLDEGDTIATNDTFRSRVPGYIAVAIASGLPTGPVGAIGVYRFPARKKLKVGETVAAPSGDGDNE